MDFSENYKCSFQNEVQSAYFDQNLVTIHPSMNYNKKIEDKEIIVEHSIIGVSNDLKHDAYLVRVFESKAREILDKRIQYLKILFRNLTRKKMSATGWGQLSKTHVTGQC